MMRQKIFWTLALAAIAISACKPDAVTYSNGAKGHLFIIGGGERSTTVMTRFVALAGGPQAKVLVVPFASSVAEETAQSQTAELIALGCDASYVLFAEGEADLEENLKRLDGVNGVFFSGGDQNNLTKMLLGTKFLERIKEIYHNGGVVGGTSAGAAVMSKIMITGNEKSDERASFASIKANNVEVAEGFGFIDFAIIDQHFLQRKRENRLISLVLEHGLPGIGIDESTAIIVGDGHSFEVFGERSVMVVENHGPAALRTDAEGNLAGGPLSVRLLLSGDSYSFK